MAGQNYRTTLNNDYWIRVMFHGLMTGCFRSETCYEVGILKHSPPLHKLSLRVFDLTDPGSGPLVDLRAWPDMDPVKLEVKGPGAGFESVLPFQTDGSKFDRHNTEAHRHDFRWIIDFEGDDLYGEMLSKSDGKLGKHPNALRPRFRLKNSATLFTLIRSVPIIRENGRRTRVLGRGAQVVAAHIYSSKSAKLEIPGEEGFDFKPDKKYDVVLRNDCLDNDKDCFDDDDTVDTTFLGEAFRVPSGEEQIRLTLGLDGESARKMMLLERSGVELGVLRNLLQFLDEIIIEGSRYNPCGKAYYGMSNSLDDPAV